MRKLITILLIIPNITHAISVVYPEDKPVAIKMKSTEKKEGEKMSTPPKTVVPNIRTTQHRIENWQWVIYEKHKVPVQYRFILEAIRMNECNQPGGYCYRSDVKNLATACMNPKRATGDG